MARTTQGSLPGTIAYLLFCVEANPSVQVIVVNYRAPFIFHSSVLSVCSALRNHKILSLDKKIFIAKHLKYIGWCEYF
jgi:hypothetical protein